MIGVLETVLCAISIILAILIIRIENTIHAILALLFFMLAIGILYFLMGSSYVAVFQIAIYSGAMTILFLVAEYLTRR